MYTIPTLIILTIIYSVYVHKQKSKGLIEYYEVKHKEICYIFVCTIIILIMAIGRLMYIGFHSVYYPCEGCRFQPVVNIYYNADGKRIEEKDMVFKKCVNLPFYKF